MTQQMTCSQSQPRTVLVLQQAWNLPAAAWHAAAAASAVIARAARGVAQQAAAAMLLLLLLLTSWCELTPQIAQAVRQHAVLLRAAVRSVVRLLQVLLLT
jgi:hypothetical protein